VSAPRPWFERWFDGVYLEIYAHRDAGEAERGTRALLEPLGLGGRRVLDLACGPGRWLHAVRRRGAAAVGLDLSEALLHAARAAAPEDGAPLVRADMRVLPFLAASFDLVLSMFTSFGYFATADEDRGVLREIARVLRPGGSLVLDFLNATQVRRSAAAITTRRVGEWEVREARAVTPDGERIVKEIELRSAQAVRSYREEVRLWEPAPLQMALADAGLATRACWGDYDGAAFAADTSARLILHAQRTSVP
jgi:ubiquinone/menaquinone biosynthesis C-methylase UbiE